MHTALVQRLLQDRSAWEFAHRYEDAPAAEPVSKTQSASSAHFLHPSHA
jgi:UDP-3-O-[3-hydroxymyristoyl] N-acetylglucosamine deacetylase